MEGCHTPYRRDGALSRFVMWLFRGNSLSAEKDSKLNPVFRKRDSIAATFPSMSLESIWQSSLCRPSAYSNYLSFQCERETEFSSKILCSPIGRFLSRTSARGTGLNPADTETKGFARSQHRATRKQATLWMKAAGCIARCVNDGFSVLIQHSFHSSRNST